MPLGRIRRPHLAKIIFEKGKIFLQEIAKREERNMRWGWGTHSGKCLREGKL